MSTLIVEAKFMPLAVLLLLFPPRVEIDGGPAQKIKWGRNELQVSPGAHSVSVYFPYLWIMRHAGKNTVDVTVQEGQPATVRYRAPLIVVMKGKMSVA